MTETLKDIGIGVGVIVGVLVWVWALFASMIGLFGYHDPVALLVVPIWLLPFGYLIGRLIRG
jgi:hypothetical protein